MPNILIGSKVEACYLSYASFANLGNKYNVSYSGTADVKFITGIVTNISVSVEKEKDSLVTILLDNGKSITVYLDEIIKLLE